MPILHVTLRSKKNQPRFAAVATVAAKLIALKRRAHRYLVVNPMGDLGGGQTVLDLIDVDERDWPERVASAISSAAGSEFMIAWRRSIGED